MTDYMNEEKIYTQADLNEAVTKAISDMSKVLEEKERFIAGLRMTYQASTLEKVKNTTEMINAGMMKAQTHPEVNEILLTEIDATLKIIAYNIAAVADAIREE